jgi:Tol biopolymer transport system component
MASDRGDTRGRRGSGPFRGRASMIAIADAAGRAPRTLTGRGHYLWAQFSRDGQSILFARIDRGRRSLLAYYSGRSNASRERLLRRVRYGLYTMATDATGSRRITSIRGGLLGPISLSPDGSQIMLAHADAGGFSRLMAVTADGAIQTIKTFAQTILGLDFSPQGDRLALALASRRTSAISVMAASGGPLQRLTTTPDLAFAPLWSPDATTIAFIQGTKRRPFINALYTIPTTGGQPRHLS